MAWKLVDRFSKDIDLAIDRRFFGYNGDLTKKQNTVLRIEAGQYATGVFFEELKNKFSERDFEAKFTVVESTAIASKVYARK